MAARSSSYPHTPPQSSGGHALLPPMFDRWKMAGQHRDPRTSWWRGPPMFRNTAHVYDLIYSKHKDYPAEAREVHALIQSRKPGAHSLLDVACGTGAHLLHLRPWYDVVGLDSDPGMLREALGRLPGARLVEADMRSFLL